MATFYDRFCECAERWPNNTALEIQRRDRVESCTYLQLKQMSESIGRWLEEGGLRDGARVAILAENHPRWVAVYLAAIAAGCTVVPLDTALHADQIAKLLKDCGASVVFCDARHADTAREAVAELAVGLVLTNPGDLEDASISARWFGDLDSILAAGPGKFVASLRSPEDVAALLYTSGTTANPKGVMLTNANLMGEADAVSGWAQLGPDDAVLGILPMFHVLAGMANLLLPLVNGARVVYLETLNTTELLRALQERNITAFAVVPQFFYLIHERIFKEVEKGGLLARRGLRILMKFNRGLRRSVGINAGKLFFGKVHAIFGPRMRLLVTGGSRFDPQIALDFYDLGIDVLQAYGLTETTGGAFVNAVGDYAVGSVGKPLRGVQGKIVNGTEDSEGHSVGEIAIAGPIVMKGYWNRPDATSAVLKEGWLHTGDLGYFDAKGNLFITGRQKELIVLANGKNIYPEEIEAHYLKSTYIKELCVMGLEARAGDPGSERLYAAVVPNFEVLKQRKIVNAKEVIRFDIEGLSAKLPSTKRIGSYEIWQDDLPRTTTRKLKRFEILKRVKANRGKKLGDAEISSEKPIAPEESEWLERPEVQRGLKVIRERARNLPSQLRPSHNLELDLGLDSMQRVELLVALEQELGGDVEESRLSEIYTVGELVDEILQSAGSGKTRQLAGWREVLREEPSDPDVLLLAKSRPISAAVLFLASRFVQIVSRDRFELKVSGLEKVPQQGPFLLCSNHQSFIDAVIMSSVLPWPVFRGLFSVGTSEIFGSGFMRRLARLLRVVVVDPDANLVPAMRGGAFGLRHGRVLILYPEGERSIDGSPKTFKKGAAILAIHEQVPVVPVAIGGFHDVWPRGKGFQKFAPLKIAFGDPIYPPSIEEASEDAYEQLTAELRKRVFTMWSELRGGNARANAAVAG